MVKRIKELAMLYLKLRKFKKLIISISKTVNVYSQIIAKSQKSVSLYNLKLKLLLNARPNAKNFLVDV